MRSHYVCLVLVAAGSTASVFAQKPEPPTRDPAVFRAPAIAVPAQKERDEDDDAIPLHVAAKLKLITGTIIGRGHSSGDALEIRLKRLKAERLRIELAPGTVFGPSRATVQRMVGLSIRGGPIVLEDDEWHTYIIEAYCLDFEKSNPSQFDKFTMDDVSEEYATLLTQAKGTLTTSTSQTALWIYLDARDALEIPKHFPVSNEDVGLAAEFVRDFRAGKAASNRSRRQFADVGDLEIPTEKPAPPAADLKPGAGKPASLQGFGGPPRPFGGPRRGFGKPK